MQLFVTIMVGAVLLYLALRVVQMKRPSMPFLIAYPLFVVILLGGGVALFVGFSWGAVLLDLGHEASLAYSYGLTALGLFVLWRVARRVIG
ncbi:MAG: hypothetical protein JNK07_06160 [Alphaproteobacteria bacterium]|nr:hypothetical protein [Alphaproteobacteria bacterium]